MRTHAFYFCLAATVLLASCAKEVVSTDNVEVSSVISLGMADTKTQLGELNGTKRKVYWADGDQVMVNGIPSDALAGIPAGSTKADFTVSGAVSAPLSILYPSAAWKDASTITLPATQEYVAGNIAPGVLAMAGYSTDGASATMNYLCALIKVSLRKDTATGADNDMISNVSFKGKANEQVSGDFTIDYAAATLESLSNNGPALSVAVPLGQSLPDSDALTVYIAVPARTYSAGFTVTVTDIASHSMSMSYTKSVALQAGHVYNMEEMVFKPDAEASTINIGSATELIAFANNYNNLNYLNKDITVVLTSDISFDSSTSAQFAATKGIGTADDGAGSTNYYHGLFDGNGKSIKNYSGSAPIFAYIGSSGTVKDLTIDSSCSFEFDYSASSDHNFGALANYHKGVIDNVKVNANVSLGAVSDADKLTSLGGIVGRSTVGEIKNSTFGGAIEVPDGFKSTGKLLLGGIVGYTTNETGKISGCTLDGTIGVAAQITSTDKANPYLVVGGIVGYNRAAVSDCSTNNHPTVTTLHSGTTSVGTIVVKSEVSYYTAVGGIVGLNEQNEVSACVNGANIFNTIFKLNYADASARYMKVGGIVGRNDADGIITGCTNNASVQHRSNPRLQSLAGIAGYNAGTVTGCTNTGAVSHMTTSIDGASKKGGRIVNIAGVIGENIEDAKVSDVHNSGNLQISAMECNYDSDNDKPVCEARLGGVIAYNLAAIDGGSSKNITNSGQVYFNTNFNLQFIGYELGGVVGYSTASVQNAKNSGYVVVNWNSDANVASKMYLGGIVGMMAGDGTISGCVNEGGENKAGEVYPNVKASTTAGHKDIFAGGILGYSTNNVTIYDCSNSGYVHGGNSSRVNGTPFYVGGIVAYLAGVSRILDCSNTGMVYNAHNNNTDTIGKTPLVGGMAGYLEGTEADPIIVGGSTGCTVDASVGSNRGWAAGIAGYAKYVNMSSCTVMQDINCAARASGGLVGQAQNCTIASSSFKGEKVHSNNTQTTTGQGGLVGQMANTVVDGCSCYATTLTNNVSVADVGAIVGVSVEGNTIKNCHYKGTVTTTAGSVPAKIAGSGEFTDGGGNAADL